MSKKNFKNSFILLTATVLIAGGFFMFAGTASAAAFCSVSADKNTHTTIGGNVVYCDNSLNMWTPTADVAGSQTTYTWGSFGTLNDSNGLGSSYPAANYCDTLTYAGYSDWVLPSCQSELDETNNCQLYQFYASAGATPSWDVNYSSGLYWASTGIGTTAAENMDSRTGFVYSNSRTANNNIRCVRSNPTYSVIAGTMTRASGDASSTINIDLASTMEGATVTLTVAPKTGMQMQAGTLVATYNDGSLKTLTLSGSGPYTFTMPAYAVTVTATFVIIPPTLWGAPTMVGEDVWFDYQQNNDYMYALQLTGSVKINGVNTGNFNPGTGVLVISASEFPTSGVYTIVASATGYVDNSATQIVQNPTISYSNYDATTGYLTLTGVDFNHTGRGIYPNKFTFKGKNSQTYTLTDTPIAGASSSTEATLYLSVTDKAAVNLLLDKPGNYSSDGVYYNLAAAAGWQTGAAENATNRIIVNQSPLGTMAATTFSIKGTQTKTINPITITDVGGEVNQAGYIYVWLPSQFGSLAGSPPYAKWDSSQTTATIVDTGSGVVSPTVSYYAGNNSNVPNVVKLDITTPFSPGDSVTFSGLSIITYGQTTNQSYPLLWSVDGGYSYNTTDSNAIMSVDVTAPIFVGAYPKTGKVQANGSRKVSILTEINEDGAAYYVVVAHGAATPSVAQVIAGHNSADTAAIDAGNVAVTAYSARSFMTAVLGADATQYDVYVVGQDAAGNTTAATGITVTTPATTTYAVIAGTMTKESGDTTSTVNIDVTPVAAGGTVTLTIVPKDGMELKTGTLVATYNDGLQKTLILAGTGPYTFTMPAYAVTVTATFEAISCPSVFNASTYKAYPICGAATCNSGYVLSNGACVASGGSGGSIMLPVTPVAISLNGEIPDLAFTINNGAKVTTIPELNLNLNANPATVRGYIVSLDANFTNVGILAYPSTPAIFILPSKAGSYTLYLKYYSTTGVYSKLYTQSISFKPETTLPTYTPAPVDTTALITRYLFKRTLQLGSKGMDVKALQQFLNVNGYILSKNGAGSPGNETATFGPATKAALIKFQKTNKIFPAVGYFGPITIDAVNTK